MNMQGNEVYQDDGFYNVRRRRFLEVLFFGNFVIPSEFTPMFIWFLSDVVLSFNLILNLYSYKYFFFVFNSEFVTSFFTTFHNMSLLTLSYAFS
jgi:hypothetical protein